MPRIGPMEIMIVLVIVLLVFGVGKLPQVGKSIGEALKGFREGSTGEKEAKNESQAVAAPEAPKMSEEELVEFKKWQELKSKAGDNS